MLTNFFPRWIQTHNSLSDFRYEKEWTRNEHGYYIYQSKAGYIIPQRAKLITLMNLNNFVRR